MDDRLYKSFTQIMTDAHLAAGPNASVDDVSLVIKHKIDNEMPAQERAYLRFLMATDESKLDEIAYYATKKSGEILESYKD